MKKYSENDIVNDVCYLLSYHKLFYWRSNNMPVWDKDHYRAMPKWSKWGVPDILVVLPSGKFLGIECKTATGKQSEHQKKFQQECPGYYLLARNIQEVENFLQGLI